MKRLPLTLIAAAALSAPALAQSTTPPPAPQPMPTATPQTVQVPISAKKTAAKPAPPKDEDENRVGISGVWEIAIQAPKGVMYTHFKLVQNGTVLTGQYLDDKGKKFPLSGTIDGKNIHVVVTLSDGTALVFSGSQDSGTDMIGTLNTAQDVVGFTASYRPKYKWIDNLTPGTGGVTGQPGVP